MRVGVVAAVIFGMSVALAQGFQVRIEPHQRPDKDATVMVRDVVDGEYEVSLWRVDSLEWLFQKAWDANFFRYKKRLLDEVSAAVVLANAKKRPSALSEKPDEQLKKIKPHLTYLWTKMFKEKPLKSEGVWKERLLNIGRLKTGIYLVRVRRAVFEVWGYLTVASVDFVARVVGSDLLVWVVRKSDGAPVANAEVSLVDTSGKVLERGITPANGLLILKNRKSGKNNIVVRHNNEVLFASVWQGGAFFPTKIYIYTDRPLYRPGERVYFRGVVRVLTPDGPRYPGQMKIRWFVQDAKYRRVAQGEINVNRFGTFNGKIDLPEKPSLGVWHLYVLSRHPSASSTIAFEVRAYRKPDFKVTLKADKAGYVQGEKVKVKIEARYLFGPPVTEGELTLRVHRRPWFFDPFARQRLGFRIRRLEAMPQDVLVFEKKIKLSNGYAEVAIPTTRSPYDAFYVIEAQVTDKTSGIAVFASQMVRVTRAAFGIGVKTDRNIYMVGEESRITVRVSGFGSPVSDVPIRIAVYDTRNVRIARELLRSDNLGEASCTVRFTQPGYYRVIARATDAFDNPVSAAQPVLVVSKEGGVPTGGNWLEIIPDKESYKPGETARFVILSSAVPAWRLVTIESSHLNDVRVEHISATVQVVEVQVTETMAPALFLWVASFHNGRFGSATRMVTVEPVSFRLKIRGMLTPKEGRPGKQVKLEVALKDYKGRPVVGEFSVAMVDEALFMLKEQSYDDPAKFFLPIIRREGIMPQAVWRYPSSRPALWRLFRSVWEKEQKEMNKVWAHFWRRRGFVKQRERLARHAAAPLIPLGKSMEGEEDDAGPPPSNAPGKVAAKGGLSGHVGLKEIPKSVYLRKSFATTAFWRASVTTNADGKAILTISLPDNITTWRFTIVAVAEAEFGIAKKSFVSRLPVMAQIIHPRFLRVGDVAVLGVRGHNETGKRAALGVRFEAQNLKGEPVTKQSEVETGKHLVAEGEFLAEDAGEAVLRAAARSETEADATEVRIPVLPRGEKQRIGTVLTVGTEPKSWEFTLPDDFEALKVRIGVSCGGYAAAIQQSLRYLVKYPYG